MVNKQLLLEHLNFYKEKYDLDVGLSVSPDIVKSDFYYSPNEKIIYMSLDTYEKDIIFILLHEIAHAIQHKRGVLKHMETKGVTSHYIWNQEIAAEKFAMKEYNRRYRSTFGKQDTPTMVKSRSYMFDFFDIKVSKREGKRMDKRMKIAVMVKAK